LCGGLVAMLIVLILQTPSLKAAGCGSRPPD